MARDSNRAGHMALLTTSQYAFTESTYSNAELSHQVFPKK